MGNEVTRRLIERHKALLLSPKRYKVLKGGRGSGKSWLIAQTLLEMSLVTKLRILCAREIQNSIRDSVWRLLVDTIDRQGWREYFEVTYDSIKTKTTGSELLFKGLRLNPSIKSTEGIDICWVEEAQLTSEESWRVLIPTIRKEASQIWISFNPDTADDPVWKRFVAHERDDVLLFTVNWNDNPYFPDVLRDEKDWHYKTDPGGAANVWGGELRQNTAASIFTGHYVVESVPQEIEEDADGIYLGADFGFSQDPSTLVRCVIKDRTLYITHEAWGLNVKNSKLKELYSAVPDFDKLTITADCARPETIDYLADDCGLFMKPCTKYAGSIEDGISKIKAFEKVVIDPRCQHTADEFRLYSYKVDRLTGAITTKIEDKHNHCIDAVRYALNDVLSLNGGLAIWANLK